MADSRDDLARLLASQSKEDDYPVDPMTGIPIGVSRTEPEDDSKPRKAAKSSPVRYKTASPLVNITDQDIGNAMTMAMALRRSRAGGFIKSED